MEFNNLARLQYRYANLWMYASILISYSMEKWYDNHSPLIYSLNKVMLTALLDCVVLNEDTSAFIEVKNSSLPSFLARLRTSWRGVLRHAYIKSSILTLESSSLNKRHLIFVLNLFFKYKIMNSGDVF